MSYKRYIAVLILAALAGLMSLYAMDSWANETLIEYDSLA